MASQPVRPVVYSLDNLVRVVLFDGLLRSAVDEIVLKVWYISFTHYTGSDLKNILRQV